jgi:hypothetical protein
MRDRFILMPLAGGGWGVYDTHEHKDVQRLDPFRLEKFEAWVERLNRVVDEWNEDVHG